MEFQKIQLTKKNTLNMVFKNDNGDIVTVAGANVVHKDLKACMRALIPHLAMMTEQREVYNRSLKQVEADRIQDANSMSVFKWLGVDTVTLSDEQNVISLQGTRILQSYDIIKIETPAVLVGDKDKYKYTNELSLAVDAVIYEAKAYYKEAKYGIKEGTLDFGDDDPFDGKVTSDQVPQADLKPVKKTKKAKAA